MSFTAITTDETVAGEPVTSTLTEKVRTNFNDHESRIAAVESGTNTVYPPIIFRVNGPYWIDGAENNILKTTLNFNITVTGVRVIVDEVGVSGTLEVDLKYKRGGGSYTTIFDTLPSVAFSAGNDSSSSNAVLDATDKNLQAGDILRLDITSVQVGGSTFMVRVDYNRA